MIEADELDGQVRLISLALPAPDTLWVTCGGLSQAAFAGEHAAHTSRGYALRRISAFQTAQGVRYAAIWEWHGEAPSQVRLGMTRTVFEAEAAGRGGLIHVDAATTDAGPRFSAIWGTQRDEQAVFANLSGAAFAQQAAVQDRRGYRVRQIAGYTDGGAPRFAAVFAPTSARVEFDHAIAAADFGPRARALKDQGYKLNDASGYVAGGKPYYTAIWGMA